jgi:hypothetical protein
MSFSRSKVHQFSGLLGLLLLVGCETPADQNDRPWAIDPATLKTVTGTITIKEKPLPKIVVAFFSASGIPSSGETDPQGHYTLETMGHAGVPPGEYKVVLSYYLSPDGSPQGLSARSAMVQSKTMISARETLPPSYADIQQTKLRATVPANGGEINFDVDADPQPPADKPTPEPEKPK